MSITWSIAPYRLVYDGEDNPWIEIKNPDCHFEVDQSGFVQALKRDWKEMSVVSSASEKGFT